MLRHHSGNDRSDNLADAEGCGHECKYPPWRQRRQLPSLLQAECGNGDEGAAEQHAGDERPGMTAHRHAGGDAKGFGQAAGRIGTIYADLAGDPLP